MTTETVNNYNGVGFIGLLFLIFLTLKLTGHIAWSWWWITAPLWGSFAIILVLFGLFALGVVVCAIIGALFKLRK